jgi:tRNA G18 (ribose-2'-O)-methylase SpoU
MRGYFGIGVEGISKQMNMGSLMRTAHAFGASFLFTIGSTYDPNEAGRADTSDAPQNVPLYAFETVEALRLPEDCELVGVELLEGAIDLPSFRHPRRAAYVLGPERGSLSPALVAHCSHVVKIPTKFAINLALAGALVMYDRVISVGRFAARPVAPGGPVEPVPAHLFGPPLIRRRRAKSGAARLKGGSSSE